MRIEMMYVKFPVLASHMVAGTSEIPLMLVYSSVALPTSANASSMVLLWPFILTFIFSGLVCYLLSA